MFQTCSCHLNSLSILTQPSVQHDIIVGGAKVGRHRGGTSSVHGGLNSKGTVRDTALVPILYQAPAHHPPSESQAGAPVPVGSQQVENWPRFMDEARQRMR